MMSGNNPHRFTDEEISEALKYGATKLGLNEFRSQQREGLRAFLLGHDLFVSLPTGFGKSVLFQAAPICYDYLRNPTRLPDHPKAVALVVMPLKSLIADQIRKLEDFGLHGVDISGGMTDNIREGISCAKYSHIFASPESLLEEDGREVFALMKDRLWICGFFIDESHCVSKWGSSSGDTRAFRSAYGKLGEVRVKLRADVAAVALTATATREVRRSTVDSLGLRNYVLVSESPDKQNIKHVVLKSRSRDFDRIFSYIISEVKVNGSTCERTIIYCQSRKVCSEVYSSFLHLLPKDLHKHVEMFHTNTENDVQQRVIREMSIPTGEIRVLIATIAYGMGVDSSAVHSTVLCGRTTAMDDYVQMSGRVGRDGAQSIAVTVCYPGDTAGRASSTSMKEFIAGSRCRRDIIKEEFGTPSKDAVIAHACCDVCAPSCECGCQGKEQSNFEKDIRKSLEKSEENEFPLNIPTASDVDKLERRLEEYRRDLLSSESDFIYCGPDIACGLSEDIIRQIVRDCNVQMDFHNFVHRYSFPRSTIARNVWAILCDTLGRSQEAVGDVPVDSSIMYESDDSEDFSEFLTDEYERPVIVSDSD